MRPADAPRTERPASAARATGATVAGARAGAASVTTRVSAIAPGADSPELVTHCLTVQGPQQGLAMVNGKKRIENRGWKIPRGWYALHVGAKGLGEAMGAEWVERMTKAWPEAPAERSLPSSKIVGLIHVLEQRTPAECRAILQGDLQEVWAAGPVCHVIDQAVQLRRPIAHRGGQGLWAILPEALERMRQQLQHEGLPILENGPLHPGISSAPADEARLSAGDAEPGPKQRVWRGVRGENP